MVRSELIRKLSEANPDLASRDIEAVLSTFFEQIKRRVTEGGRVELRGFGAFSSRARDARTGCNPRNGKAVPVSAKRVPYFKPSREMYFKLNI